MKSKEDTEMDIKLRQDYTPAALYARVSSDRQDVGPVRRRPAAGAQGLRRQERLHGRARIH